MIQHLTEKAFIELSLCPLYVLSPARVHVSGDGAIHICNTAPPPKCMKIQDTAQQVISIFTHKTACKQLTCCKKMIGKR